VSAGVAIRASLAALRLNLVDARAGEDEYVLFGSAVLFLHELRAPESVGDVDVFVSRRIYDEWLRRPFWAEQRPHETDPPFLAWASRPPIHAFYDWTERDASWITAERCFASAEQVDGWQCISMAMMREIKKGAFASSPGSDRHKKHADDLELIEGYLARHPLRNVVPHLYVPDWEAMGDCATCGNVEESKLHLRRKGWTRDPDGLPGAA
jgi:hypothetical protein